MLFRAAFPTVRIMALDVPWCFRPCCCHEHRQEPTMKPDRDKARSAVLDRMAERGYDKTALAKEAGVDYGTAGDFLNGSRWPRLPTLAKIDKALGWEPGTVAGIAAGDDVPDVSGGPDDGGMLLNVDPAVYEDLTRAELAEAIATAEAVFLQKVREIRSARVAS